MTKENAIMRKLKLQVQMSVDGYIAVSAALAVFAKAAPGKKRYRKSAPVKKFADEQEFQYEGQALIFSPSSRWLLVKCKR